MGVSTTGLLDGEDAIVGVGTIILPNGAVVGTLVSPAGFSDFGVSVRTGCILANGAVVGIFDIPVGFSDFGACVWTGSILPNGADIGVFVSSMGFTNVGLCDSSDIGFKEGSANVGDPSPSLCGATDGDSVPVDFGDLLVVVIPITLLCGADTVIPLIWGAPFLGDLTGGRNTLLCGTGVGALLPGPFGDWSGGLKTLLCGADFGAVLFGDLTTGGPITLLCGAGDFGSFALGFEFGVLDETGDLTGGATIIISLLVGGVDSNISPTGTCVFEDVIAAPILLL